MCIQISQKDRGFTLVELLVVITIIGVLVGLAAGGAWIVRARAIETMTKAQLSQMEIALEAYKNEFGEYPPMLNDGNAVMRHVRSRWKRASFSDPTVPTPYDVFLERFGLTGATESQLIAASLAFWLGGYYDGTSQSYKGFCADLERPWLLPTEPGGTQRTEVRFDFSDKNTMELGPVRCYAIDKKPVVYFRSTASGEANAYMRNVGGSFIPLACVLGDFGIAVPYARSKSTESPLVWQAAKKYQLIHPGRDESFGDRDSVIIDDPASITDPTIFIAYMGDEGGAITYGDYDNIVNFTDTATLRGALNQ
ncbi:MAG: type II secretion system GspH family protein [Planctomycetaceae bacterium]|nr:type II secretion system GspH family protein [Planctomycetaceae bacterium]